MNFEMALATVMQRIMSESLFPETSEDQQRAIEAVRLALLKAWPDEIKKSRNCIRFDPIPGGGVQAVLVPHSEAAEIIAGFILWHDPAYKPSPSENLPKMIAEAKAFLGDRYAIVSNQCGND